MATNLTFHSANQMLIRNLTCQRSQFIVASNRQFLKLIVWRSGWLFSFVNLCMAYILFSSTVKRFVIRQCWSGPNNYKWGNFLCQGPSEGFFPTILFFKFFFHKKGSNSDICQPRGPEIETGWRFPVKACHAAVSSTLFIRKETPSKRTLLLKFLIENLKGE